MEIAIDYKSYLVKIFEDYTYTENSTDNKYIYMKVIRFDESPYIVSRHAIHVLEDNEMLGSAILLGAGGGTTIHERCYIIENDRVYICAGNSLCCLDLPKLNIIWKVKVDDATAFEIFKMNNDFIVHGELSVSRINENGKIIWQNYGSDIFVLQSGKKCVNINENNTISVRSWDNRKYIFDFNGNILSEEN